MCQAKYTVGGNTGAEKKPSVNLVFGCALQELEIGVTGETKVDLFYTYCGKHKTLHAGARTVLSLT